MRDDANEVRRNVGLLRPITFAVPRHAPADSSFVHPWARGVRARADARPARPGEVLLVDGSRMRRASVLSLPRSAPRPAVFCVDCGRRGHYALTDRHAYFRHANGELACTPRALESALHIRAKHVLRDGIARTREASVPLRWTRRCDRCGVDAHGVLLAAGTWSGERIEARASHGAFTYDVAVLSDEGLVLALEVRQAHSVDGPKLDAASESGVALLEFRADALVDDEGGPRWTGIAPLPPAFVFRVRDLACPYRCAKCIDRGDPAARPLARTVDAFVDAVRANGLALAASCVRCAGRHRLDLLPPGSSVAKSWDEPSRCTRELEVPGHGSVVIEVVEATKRGTARAHLVADAETLFDASRTRERPVLPDAAVGPALAIDSRWVCLACRRVSETARELERVLAWSRSRDRHAELRDAIAEALGATGAGERIRAGFLSALDREPERFDGDPAWRPVALRGVPDSTRDGALGILAAHLALPFIRIGWTSVADLLEAPHRRLALELAEGREPALSYPEVQKVAAALGARDAEWERTAAVASVLAELAKEGHTAFPGDRESLERRARSLTRSDAGSLVDAACARGVVVSMRARCGERLALRVHAERERRLALRLARLIRAKRHDARSRPVSSTLTPEQRESLALASCLRLSVVTGAAGTGKTHALRAMVESLPHETWTALAPTGKAACRLRESLHGRVPAERIGTIHRFLAARRTIDSSAYLLDEASMLDVETATRLFERIAKASAPTPRVVLVGDPNQLPSVGAGAVLRDVLESTDSTGGPIVPRVELGLVHRSTASLATVAREFLNGRAELGAIETLACDDATLPARAAELAVALGLAARPQRIQILAPTNAAVRAINREVRARVGRDAPRLGRFRDGEKVGCTKNRYKRPHAMNGEVGVLRVVRPTNQLPWAEIEFGPGDVRAPFTSLDLEDFAPAYALTIHKAQGSEWPTVILALDTSTRGLDRALAYTAITRAKEHLVVIGALGTLRTAPGRASTRVTTLAERIARCVESE